MRPLRPHTPSPPSNPDDVRFSSPSVSTEEAGFTPGTDDGESSGN